MTALRSRLALSLWTSVWCLVGPAVAFLLAAPGPLFKPRQHHSHHPTFPQKTHLRRRRHAASLSLEEVASKWMTTARNGVRLKNINTSYVDEEISLRVERTPGDGLGILLEELWKSDQFESRGLVLVAGLVANSAAANATNAAGQRVERGDALVSVGGVDVEGLAFDATVAELAKAPPGDVDVVLKRVTKRATIDITVLNADGSLRDQFVASAGTNLRTAFLLRGYSNAEIYDDETMRFDAIAQSGTNCGGEGTCGTCLVSISDGADLVCPPARVESAALVKQRRPPRWRWSCRMTVGYQNRPGKLTVTLRPQSQFQDERQKIVGV